MKIPIPDIQVADAQPKSFLGFLAPGQTLMHSLALHKIGSVNEALAKNPP